MHGVLTAVLLIVFTFSSIQAQEKNYRITLMYEADQQGNILKQQPYSGFITLKEDGSYFIRVYRDDQGTWKYIKANKQQPRDMIYFYSAEKYEYFAYPRGKMIAVWLNKPRPGVNLWVNGTLVEKDGTATSTPPAAGSTGLYQMGLIRNGRFSRTTMFSTTSAPSYYYYDEFTGNFSQDTTGVVFRPDGTYAMRVEFGGSITYEKGVYSVTGNQVRLRFSDNSVVTLTIAPNGRDLNWYGRSGILISEFFFLK